MEVNMAKNNKNNRKRVRKIEGIAVTQDQLTGRAGLAFFVRYISSLAVLPQLERAFGTIRKSNKGTSVVEMFKQILCFFVDGTSRHLVYFDHLKKDEGYAGTIETETKDMASSHTMKRFFGGFSFVRVYLFRRILQSLFIWRLRLAQPNVIELGIDTMVLDNDDAEKRHGVKPTYKKKKGFQPLQMNWNRYFVDAVFRGGDKHSNHGDTVSKMIVHMVKKIRKHYREDVPIIIRLDSGFFDQKIFSVCEELEVGYICGGKVYKDIRELIQENAIDQWRPFQEAKKNNIWEYIEFGSKRGNWKKFRRAIYSRLKNRGSQLYLPGCRPDSVIYTNIGMGTGIDALLTKAKAQKYFSAEAILANYHVRGCDELANRALKDFGHEQLPFLKFNANAAWYYTMLLGHFLLEAFQEDVSFGVIHAKSYATTVRRKLIDMAGKIVCHAGKVILKVTQSSWDSLNISDLWEKCNNQTPLPTI